MDTLTVAAVNLELTGKMGLPGILEIARQAAQAARFVVLPECSILELIGPYPEVEEPDTPEFLSAFANEWIEEFGQLSKETGSIFLAGTIFETSPGGILNVCPIVFPNGAVHRAVKNRLTKYEREVWKLGTGDCLLAFDDPPFGIAICYDAEFPEACRGLAEAGVKVLCVPSFTETVRGFQRVRWSCLARAVENQVYVIQTSLVGGFGREPLPNSYGASAIIAPSIEPFPESAILAETELNRGGIALAELDFQNLQQARQDGSVRNWDEREPKQWDVNIVSLGPVPDARRPVPNDPTV